MGKLENIPKKDIFEVPEGYFDSLPGIIQARTTAGTLKERPHYSTGAFVLRFALPVVVVLVAGLYFFRSPAQPANAEQMLASVDTKDLVGYLEQSDLTTDELLDQVQLDNQEVDAVEGQVFSLPSENEQDVDDALGSPLDF